MLNVYAMVGNINKAMSFYHTMTQSIDNILWEEDIGIYIRLLKCCAAAGDINTA